ncbi:NAD(P)/FAD-dependent oxidoreductase [Bowmanella yangjiangensis]|uniref:NAD(P)/FAD-dependent oxidoreductase n=1 Tax=Bowmanella yangjiangensis TaxID=2811230 RepID=A0ABS3CXX7_9ALTE|nr:FAD/NAD(P)-binding oxidoreductase [Bowmanella yangjiangensis]MBN7821384.1 NAD(P)/FAD-dependent oxidoreductase [Bowmanella yangjiangensis]
MTKVVVLGAGTGGMPAAYEIKQALGAEHQVVVVNEYPMFRFVPSNPWVAVGWREPNAITFPIEKYLNKKHIDFVCASIERIDPEQQQLIGRDGELIDYDYLVIATGPKLAFESIPGAGPAHFTQSICTLDHAINCHKDVEKLIATPGPAVVGAFQGASCFGPAYEYAFILDKALREAKVRHKVPVTYVTSEPYIGHLGLGGVGDSKSLLESELRQRDIKWICNAQVDEVSDGQMQVSELNRKGELDISHQLPFQHAMLIPPFSGVKAVADVEGLCNPKGFVITDEFQRSPKYPNIFSGGVCVAIPPVESTPVPTGTPKTGYMIETMMTAIAHNLKAIVVDNHPPHYKGTWHAICLADMGDTGAAFVAMPQIPPRNVTWFKKGKWVHLAKIAFEKYFMRKMKTGTSEPIYEKYVLKALGIERLEP